MAVTDLYKPLKLKKFSNWGTYVTDFIFFCSRNSSGTLVRIKAALINPWVTKNCTGISYATSTQLQFGFESNHYAGCRNYANLFVEISRDKSLVTTKMSLISFWSGSFHRLSKNIGDHCVELLKFHTVSTRGISANARRSSYRTLTTNLEERFHKPYISEPGIVNTALFGANVASARTLNVTESDVCGVQDFQLYNSLQNILENRIFGGSCAYIVFDLETTGFSYSDRIIELAARDLFGGPNSTIESLINPGKPVLNSEIHHISSHMVNNPEIPRFEEFIPIFLQFIRSRQTDGKRVALMAHNAKAFDARVLVREFRRCDAEVPKDLMFIDTLQVTRKLEMPDGSKKRSLKALAEYYNISLVGAHRAMQDVIILTEIIKRITFELKIPLHELEKLAFPASQVKSIIKPRPRIFYSKKVVGL